MADAPRIEDISTRWPLLGDPVHVVMRYAPAIRAYLGVLVRDADDADEVCQDLLARVLATGFSGVTEPLEHGDVAAVFDPLMANLYQDSTEQESDR